ncbi:hypothetical protein BT63DRAFT_379867 [Microthyrium microscopicum]|uniref:Zn(2)-C6 fungal-type domain-containing protein n=1 Tax=Microthyrium microscopicum TaxID=703497 RepID=A0A6A6TTW1_9PEZI|nr:hypothetical protein BT63DRAFT_379867 [Microthyrium microscopicum]
MVRLSCSSCHQRKVKCDLNLPCGPCTKRGEQSSCSRKLPDEVQKLLSRNAELEAQLQAQSIRFLSPTAARNPGQSTEPTEQYSPSPTEASLISSLQSSRNTHSRRTGSIQPQAHGDDAATILEFLAWGRQKDQEFHHSPENESGPRRHIPIVSNTSSLQLPLLTKSIKDPQLDMLQTLLPSKKHVYQLVDFHSVCLVWYHGSYNTVVFQNELDDFYTKYQGNVKHFDVNLQWVALLFSLLTGAITCATDNSANHWGFQLEERLKLSNQWYNATITCLNLSDYMEQHTIYSVQALSSLTISAHTIGKSNTQSVLLSAANRIAESLGLNRLGEEQASSVAARRIKRETGRRIWCQLCTQSWFSIPFSESFTLNPKHFDTAKPLNCNDSSTQELPLQIPTMTSYCNYLYDIAALMPQLQEAMASSNTLYTKYEQVLLYDEKMRALVKASLPTFLSNHSPLPESWPIFVPWARRMLALCAAHKIIMIHRKFLGPSFTNSTFSFTRRTCIAASKTIINEAQAASDTHGPVLWIEQAFVVAAAIILCLDAFHRQTVEPEYNDHKALAIEASDHLSGFPMSMIASRGIKLLSFLMKELDRKAAAGDSYTRKRARESEANQEDSRNTRPFEPQLMSPSANPEPHGFETDDVSWRYFEDFLPPQTGFGGEELFLDFS